MKIRLPKTAEVATEIEISLRPICTSLAPALTFTDQISDFMPRWMVSPIRASPRTKGSFQKRLVYMPAFNSPRSRMISFVLGSRTATA